MKYTRVAKRMLLLSLDLLTFLKPSLLDLAWFSIVSRGASVFIRNYWLLFFSLICLHYLLFKCPLPNYNVYRKYAGSRLVNIVSSHIVSSLDWEHTSPLTSEFRYCQTPFLCADKSIHTRSFCSKLNHSILFTERRKQQLAPFWWFHFYQNSLIGVVAGMKIWLYSLILSFCF